MENKKRRSKARLVIIAVLLLLIIGGCSYNYFIAERSDDTRAGNQARENNVGNTNVNNEINVNNDEEIDRDQVRADVNAILGGNNVVFADKSDPGSTPNWPSTGINRPGNNNGNNNPIPPVTPSRTITITYIANGANISRTMDSCVLSAGQVSCNLNTPIITRDGWTIVGWSTSPNATVAETLSGANRIFTGNTRLYAITKQSLTANFVLNGATSISATSRTCTKWNNDVSCNVIAPTITRTNGNVIGWNSVSNATTGELAMGASLILTTNNLTYYAITNIEHTATFNANGTLLTGTLNPSCTRWNTQVSCEINAPTITRAGWNILGWSSNATAESASIATTGASVSLNLTGNQTLNAISRYDVTITFNANGATSIGANSLSCSYFNTNTSCDIIAPTITRPGRDVIGWNTNASATTSTWNVGASRAVSTNETWYAITNIILVPVPVCDNLVATGSMGGTSTWNICDDGVMVITGGTANNGSGNLNQNRVPEIYRPLVNRIVFADVVTIGNSAQDIFNGFTNLTTIDNIHLLDTSTATTMRSMFANTPNLESLDLTTLDTSNVANFLNMFLESGIINLNVSGWDTSSATNVNSMFRNATRLTALDTSSWTFAGVPNGTLNGAIDMARMFENTHSLTTIGDVSGWVTSGVTRYYSMFLHARSLTSLPGIEQWNTSSGIRLQSMFSNTWALTELDLSNWQTSTFEDLTNTFRDNGLERLNLDGWNISSVVSMGNIFANTDARFALRELTLGAGWQTTNTTNLRNAPSNAEYTGLWVNVGSGTVQNPEASYQFTTGNLLMNNAPHATGPHTWVWQPTP